MPLLDQAEQDRVPAADAKISQQAMDETFYLSNIAPQVGDGFNRHCKQSKRHVNDCLLTLQTGHTWRTFAAA